MTNSPLIIYALVFITVLLLVEALFRLVLTRRRNTSEVGNRLIALKQKSGAENAYAELLLRRNAVDQNTRSSLRQRFRKYYSQTGLELGASRKVLYILVFFLVGFVFSALFLNLGLIFNLVFGLVAAVALSALAIHLVRKRRIKKFTYQLAPGIDIIVRSLNAGHPLNAAINLLAREMPDPIGSEFGILADQMTFGSGLDQAMANMVERVGAPELELLAVTVSVQRGTGGNLSEILENLAQMIRDRLMIRAKVKAISAEGRITAWIMMLFPFGLFFMIKALVPNYFDEVWESGYGGIIVTGCLIVMGLGMIVIRKLVNFDF